MHMQTNADLISSCRKERGTALMIMLIIMVVGALAIFVNLLNQSSNTIMISRNKSAAETLALAKAALIGYAVTYSDTHSGTVYGYLPCPDINGSSGEGVSSTPTCGSKNVSTLGRLPWKSLDIAMMSDSNGECLWYALSGTYKNNPKTDMMNWDNNGQFQVLAASGVVITGQSADSNAVAVILAPNSALVNLSQAHTPDGSAPLCNGNYTASNYLDNDSAIGANNSTPSLGKIYAAGATDNINDQIVFITRDDIFNAIKKRTDFGTFVSTLLSTSTSCLATLDPPVSIDFSGSSPAESSGGTMIGSLEIGRVPQSCLTSPLDNWQDNLLYARCSSGTNCMTVNAASCRGVVIFPGERSTSQYRNTNAEKNTWSNYLEDSPNPNLTAFTTGGISFSGATAYSSTSSSADLLACIP